MNALVSWPIARVTARERGLSPSTLVIAALLVLSSILRGSSQPWLVLLVAFVGAGALAEEVDSGHAQLVLLRPITRAQWVGGRLVGLALVVCASAAAAWVVAIALSLYRNGAERLGWDLLSLPACLLAPLAWLATLVALSAVVRGWSNVGVVIVVSVAWFLTRNALPLALPSWHLEPVLSFIDRYFGPQDLCGSYTTAKLLWDLLWLALAWLVAVQLFRRRELAKRRT